MNEPRAHEDQPQRMFDAACEGAELFAGDGLQAQGEVQDLHDQPVLGEAVLSRSLSALQALRATLDGDSAADRIPAELRGPEATSKQLAAIRDAALADAEKQAEQLGLDEALTPTTVPTRFRFQESRHFEQLFEAAEQDSRKRLPDSVEAELARPIPLPDAAADAIPVPEFTLTQDSQDALGEDAAASDVESLAEPVLDSSVESTRKLRAPGLLWGRIRADIQAIRRAHRLAQRHRRVSRISLAAAVVVVAVMLWPENREEQPGVDIRITVVDQPFDEGMSALSVMRRLHDGR